MTNGSDCFGELCCQEGRFHFLTGPVSTGKSGELFQGETGNTLCVFQGIYTQHCATEQWHSREDTPEVLVAASPTTTALTESPAQEKQQRDTNEMAKP